MQLAGDAAALIILHLQEPAGHLSQSVLGAFPVRYIRVQFQEAERLALLARPCRPAARGDDGPSIPPLMDKLALPAAVTAALRLDVTERFGKFRAQGVGR